MERRNNNQLLNDLIYLNADQWNILLATELGMSVEKLKLCFLQRDDLLDTDPRVKIYLDKEIINQHYNNVKHEDDDNFKLIANQTEEDKIENISEFLQQPTSLDRFSIRIHEGKKIAESISVTGKVIVGMDFSESDLSYSYFCHCIFYNCSFRKTHLLETTLKNCIFNKCIFDESELSNSIITKTPFMDCSIKNANLDVSVFTDCHFINAKLNNTKMVQSIFIDSGFTACDLTNVDMLDSKLNCVAFSLSDIIDSNLRKSNWCDVILVRSTFSKVDVSFMSMTSVTHSSCRIDAEYEELFKMNHMLFSPGIVEWEDNSNGSSNV